MNNLDSDIFDVILKSALIEVEKEDVKNTEIISNRFSEWPVKYKPSKNFKRSINKLMKQSKRQNISNVQGRRIRVAAIACIAVIFCIVVVQANKVDLFDVLFNVKEKYTAIELTKEMKEKYIQNLTEGWKGTVYFPEYIPKSYILSDVATDEITCRITFIDGDNQIILTQYKNIDNLSIRADTQDSEFSKIDIKDGLKGLYVNKGDQHILYFNNDEYYMTLRSNSLSKQEMANIAKSLKIIEP